MITTKNKHAHKGDMKTIKDRAAYLVQSLEGCPLEFTLETLAIFDKWNSLDAKNPSAKRWIRQFCGFESRSSGKDMEPIIEVLNDGQPIDNRDDLNLAMKDMRDAACP